jgi:hypothetical protein
MGTTREDIRRWLKEGKPKGATHMIVMCDTFDYDDYPVYIGPCQNIRSEVNKRNGRNMQKVMEVYSYNHDLEDQLTEHRAFHYD